MRRSFVFLAIAAVGLAAGMGWGQGVAGADATDARAAIREDFARYTATVNSGDLEGWMALWAPGGVRMPPGAPMTVGLDAIRESMTAPMALYDNRIAIAIEEITVAGDFAYARGTYTLDSAPREGDRGGGNGGTHVDGKYTTIFQRQADGSWKIFRDIFNSNVPAGGTSTGPAQDSAAIATEPTRGPGDGANRLLR